MFVQFKLLALSLHRPWPGIHSLPSCCVHDALVSLVGGPLLHHDCFSRVGQSGTKLCTIFR